jgi:hypothetical protein
MSPSSQFGSHDHVERLRSALLKQVDYLQRVRPILASCDDAIKHSLAPLLFSVCDSCRALSILSQHYFFRDSYVCSRTILETAVTFCFIASKGEPLSEKAQRHALQKWWRDLLHTHALTRDATAKSLPHISLTPPTEALREALDAYTGKKGREITSWTEENVVERIDRIEQELGDSVSASLRLATFAIYRNASEIVHGTLYGAMFASGHFQIEDMPSTPEEFNAFYRRYFAMLFMVLLGPTQSMIRALKRYCDVSTIAHESDAFLSTLKIKEEES